MAVGKQQEDTRHLRVTIRYSNSVEHAAVLMDLVDIDDLRRSRPQTCSGETRRDATERDGGWLAEMGVESTPVAKLGIAGSRGVAC